MTTHRHSYGSPPDIPFVDQTYCNKCGEVLIRVEFPVKFDAITGLPWVEPRMACPKWLIANSSPTSDSAIENWDGHSSLRMDSGWGSRKAWFGRKGWQTPPKERSWPK